MKRMKTKIKLAALIVLFPCTAAAIPMDCATTQTCTTETVHTISEESVTSEQVFSWTETSQVWHEAAVSSGSSRSSSRSSSRASSRPSNVTRIWNPDGTCNITLTSADHSYWDAVWTSSEDVTLTPVSNGVATYNISDPVLCSTYRATLRVDNDSNRGANRNSGSSGSAQSSGWWESVVMEYSFSEYLTSSVFSESWYTSVICIDPGPGPGPNPVPEPTTMLLFGSGLSLLAFYRRKMEG